MENDGHQHDALGFNRRWAMAGRLRLTNHREKFSDRTYLLAEGIQEHQIVVRRRSLACFIS